MANDYERKQYNDKLAQSVQGLLQADKQAVDNEVQAIAELAAILPNFDPEYSPYRTLHCNRTGRPTGELSLNAIRQCIAIHTEPRRIHIALQSHCTSQIAPDWLFTDPTALSAQFRYDPVGYFIYSTSLIYQPVWSEQHRTAWDQLQEKREAWENCSALYGENPAAIIACNEMLRRFLGLIAPHKTRRIFLITIFKFAAITQSEINLELFKGELESVLTKLVRKNFNEKQFVTKGTIANIRCKLGGIQSYTSQTQIKNLTSLESVMYDLRGFMEGKCPESVQVYVGLSPRDTGKPKVENLHTVSPMAGNGKVQLKFATSSTDASNASNASTNPFAAMFARNKEDKGGNCNG